MADQNPFLAPGQRMFEPPGGWAPAPAAAAAQQGEWGRVDRERYPATDFREEPGFQPGQGQGQFRGDAQCRAQTRGGGYQGGPENWRPPNQRYQDRASAGQNPGINLNRAPPRTLGDQFAKITIVAAEHSVLRVDTREHQGPIQGRLIDPFACQHPARVEMNYAGNAPRTGDGARLAPGPKNGTYVTFTFFKTLGAYQLVIVGSVEYGVSQESAPYTKEIREGLGHRGFEPLGLPVPTPNGNKHSHLDFKVRYNGHPL